MTNPAPHIDPASFTHKSVTTCGHKYHYVEEGDPKGEPLLLVHGFPDLWYGWRHQIKYLAKLGYRVIAVDCIGYGQTDSPMELKEFGLKSVCAHLAGILDALDIPKVTIIGHDWGGAVVWRFGLYYPERLHGIISFCTPFNPPATKFRTLEEIVEAVPEFEYQLNFANPDTVAQMDENVVNYVGIIAKMGNFGEKDAEYMISQYKHSGFRGPLNFYKTTKVNFDDERGIVGKTIDMPCWMVVATKDHVLKPHMSAKMKDYMPQLKYAQIEAGHFVMTEKPDETNATLKTCLEDLAQRRAVQSKSSL